MYAIRSYYAVNKDDLEFFKKAGDEYKELTGIKTQPPLRDPKGTFFQYGYYQFGILSLSTPGWGIDMPAESGDKEDKASDGGQRGPAGVAPGRRGAGGP